VKLLFDQNLSRKLVDRLRDDYPESKHVTAVGLETATDREIWEYARQHDYVIVSKDSDFRQLAFLYGPPPKVVWLRVGNASTSAVLQIIVDHMRSLEAFMDVADAALLVLPAATLD
jgi:predicted nuclease of predicted toxin-antitoxin system